MKVQRCMGLTVKFAFPNEASEIEAQSRWTQSDRIIDAQRAASRLLDRDQPGPERLAELRAVLRDMIREYRAAHPRATYREALAAVLDYRGWHAFELVLITPGEGEARLTRAKHSVMSSGEICIRSPMTTDRPQTVLRAKTQHRPAGRVRDPSVGWHGKTQQTPPSKSQNRRVPRKSGGY
jgi:hypothetical protein